MYCRSVCYIDERASVHCLTVCHIGGRASVYMYCRSVVNDDGEPVYTVDHYLTVKEGQVCAIDQYVSLIEERVLSISMLH